MHINVSDFKAFTVPFDWWSSDSLGFLNLFALLSLQLCWFLVPKMMSYTRMVSCKLTRQVWVASASYLVNYQVFPSWSQMLLDWSHSHRQNLPLHYSTVPNSKCQRVRPEQERSTCKLAGHHSACCSGRPKCWPWLAALQNRTNCLFQRTWFLKLVRYNGLDAHWPRLLIHGKLKIYF